MIGACHTAYDVTDRLRAKADLLAAQEALRQSQKMEAMGQLTGRVAHDFNNMLTPIVGSLDMLQRKGLGGEREQRLIAGAIQSADRAKTLVQRLLAFARRQPLQPSDVDVAGLVTGMDDAMRARAIEPFFSTKGVGKGTGLGLSMVHGLASQLGGALAITSRPGLGTNVELWLPLTEALPERADRGSGGTAGTVVAGKALLSDDDDLVRENTANMLGDLGYEVVEAASAEEALQMLRGGFLPDLA